MKSGTKVEHFFVNKQKVGHTKNTQYTDYQCFNWSHSSMDRIEVS